MFGRCIILVTGDFTGSCTGTTYLASSSTLRVREFVIILNNMPMLLSSTFSFSYPCSIRSPRPLGSEVENIRCLPLTTAAPYGGSQLSFLSVCPRAALLGGCLGELTAVRFFIKSLALPLAVPPVTWGCVSLACRRSQKSWESRPVKMLDSSKARGEAGKDDV
jgi:hypothetical protein